MHSDFSLNNIVNNVSVQYNGGLLPDIILLTQAKVTTIGELV